MTKSFYNTRAKKEQYNNYSKQLNEKKGVKSPYGINRNVVYSKRKTSTYAY